MLCCRYGGIPIPSESQLVYSLANTNKVSGVICPSKGIKIVASEDGEGYSH